MALFLDSSAVLHELLRDGLASGLEDVDESAGEVLLGFAEEGDCEAVLAGAAGTKGFVSDVFERFGFGGTIGTYRPIRWT